MRNLGLYLIKDRKNAAWVVLVMALLPVLGLPTAWICLVILSLITLHKGAKEGLWVLAWALLPAIALSFWGYTAFAVSIAFRGLSIWILSLLLRRFQSWAIVIEAATVFAVLVVLILHLFVPDLRDWWSGQLMHQAAELNGAFDLKIKAETMQSWAKTMSVFASGLTATSMLLIDFLLLMLARAWQAALVNPGGFRSEFYKLRIGYSVSMLLIIDILFASMGLGFAIDVLPILLLPFVFAGLSLVHLLLHGKKVAGVILGLVYTLIVLLFPYTLALLALFGFVDSWMDFRRRFNLGR